MFKKLTIESIKTLHQREVEYQHALSLQITSSANILKLDIDNAKIVKNVNNILQFYIVFD